MAMTERENPYYERFDEVLDICRGHDVTLSLGDACRPGSIADSTDAAQVGELVLLGDLVRRARERDVQTIVEGPGHMSLDEIEANMDLERRLCDDAPFYVLGPSSPTSRRATTTSRPPSEGPSPRRGERLSSATSPQPSTSDCQRSTTCARASSRPASLRTRATSRRAFAARARLGRTG
jgi:hypothetical protein